MDGVIKSSGGKSRNVNLEFRNLSAEERRKAALKGLGINWALSLGFLPLPPIHWVATPFFFFFGFYWSYRKYSEHEYLNAIEFLCPECEGTVKLPEQAAKNPREITCPKCRYLLRLSW